MMGEQLEVWTIWAPTRRPDPDFTSFLPLNFGLSSAFGRAAKRKGGSVSCTILDTIHLSNIPEKLQVYLQLFH